MFAGGNVKKAMANLLVGLVLGVASAAQAAPTLCSAGAIQPDGLSVGDVTFNAQAATDCFGVATGTATSATLGFDGFTFVTEAAAGGQSTGSFQGVDFTLNASTSDILGTWSLAWTGVTGPFTVDLVAVVQTASTFATYFFDNLAFVTSPGTAQGDWIINYLLSETTTVQLTSFSIYMANLTSPTGGGGGGGGTTVDEPATLALIALAILGLAVPGRRRAAPRGR